MDLTGTQIEQIARENNMKFETVTPGKFSEVEYLAVSLETFVTAFFKMDNATFEFSYSHTYNAKNDKTSKKTPKIFK